MTPLDDLATIDVPCQVDKEVSVRYVLSQQVTQVLLSHAILDKSHALLDPGLQRRVVWIEVHDRDASGIDAQVLDQNGKCTARYCSKTDE